MNKAVFIMLGTGLIMNVYILRIKYTTRYNRHHGKLDRILLIIKDKLLDSLTIFIKNDLNAEI